MSAHAFFSSSSLHLMNASISGWSMFKMTILAALRVFPPDLITPAKASYPFIKDTGPEAAPPPDSCSREDRTLDTLVPVPDPPLKSIPSRFERSKIEPMLSWTELMKQAEHCGCFSIPTLNQTGELNAIF